MKAMKLEMKAMKADKVMKDEQLYMLYYVIESHLNIDIHAAFNEIEVKRAEECRIERERRLAEEATRKNKGVIEETQEAGGSSSQVDVEMVEAEVVPQGFMLAREVLMLKWKDEEEVEEESQKFILIGKPSSARKARGVIVESDSDIEILGDEDENDKSDKKGDKDDKDNDDDNDQGASGLLIVNPNVEQRIEDYLNDEINEQADDQHQEASSSGKQQADQLGLEDGKFKFDIEDEIPQSPEREFEFRYAQEVDDYNDVIVEDASDSSDEETDFHYSGVDETFPSLAKMFKDRNEDEIRRKIVEKITTEGVPKTIPRENLAEERKKMFKVMPKERKSLRALQYFTHDKNISWGDILS
ncbi:hypothetical protein Hanom_Chr01g00030911 [Helianthus anomalus]